MREDNIGHILTDVLEIHFIELPKLFQEIPNMKDILHRWLIFLGNPNEEVLYLLETKDSWDEVSRINGAIKEKEFNIAIKMLDTGSSVAYVAEMTGLSVEEVCNLRQ